MLVVLAGLPGTGKTTLARRLVTALGAAYVRIDAIETAVIRCGLARPPVGPVGYVVAHEIAAATLSLGTPMVVDAVNPVPEARAGWAGLAMRTGARLAVCETTLRDPAEHRSRVRARLPDLPDQVVPSWDEVLTGEYVEWDETRDGARLVVDMTDTDEGVALALSYVRDPADGEAAPSSHR